MALRKDNSVSTSCGLFWCGHPKSYTSRWRQHTNKYKPRTNYTKSYQETTTRGELSPSWNYFNISENVILPKCSILVVLRYICERGGAAIHGEEAKKKNQVDRFGPRMNQQVQFRQVRTDQFGQSVRTSSDRSLRTLSSDMFGPA
jgi:hypothetical protein